MTIERTYGEWVPTSSGATRIVECYQEWWFHLVREWTEREVVSAHGGNVVELCRVLNKQPAPKVSLSDKTLDAYQFWSGTIAKGRYIFSTEDLKAELARRKKESR